jgi:hypothetical protein
MKAMHAEEFLHLLRTPRSQISTEKGSEEDAKASEDLVSFIEQEYHFSDNPEEKALKD